MAQDGDEDEIWNYKIKATPRNKLKGFKTKMTEEDSSSDNVEQQCIESDFIVIDSDDEDVFSDMAKTRQQQKEHWKLFMAKSTQKNNVRGNGKKSKALVRKKKPCAANGKNKTKQSRSSTLKIEVEGTSLSKTQNDDPSTEISSSPNSQQNYYSPSKVRNGKRKTPEPDDFSIKKTGVIDQAVEHEFSDKKRLLLQGTESHLSSYSPLTGDLIDSKNPKEDAVANSQSSMDCPRVVNVIVLEGNQCDDVEEEFTLGEDEKQEPGGFIVDDEVDLFDDFCENENMKPVKDDFIGLDPSATDQTSSSSTLEVATCNNRDMFEQNSTTDLSDSAKLFTDFVDNETALSPTKARKQTSLYTFFKARPSKVNSKYASELDDNKLKSIYSISSRPSLRSVSSTHASSSFTKENNKLNKSASVGSGFVTQPKPEESIKGTTNKKQCPFYKKIPGTSITVDAFRYGVIPGCEAYFLTHFHYDHYGGLTKKFSQPLYCSQVTANLVQSRLGINKKWINPLPLWKSCVVADATLTLMEANHCPGAVIVLFETKDGKKILHTGDFRACPEMENYVMLMGVAIDELYLDTTYCNPSYSFPSQKEVIDFVVSLVEEYVSAHPRTLVVCGAYTIGKEKIFSAIARILDSKICVMNDKKKVLDCLEDKELKSRITLNWSEGRVHVLPMGKLNLKSLSEHHERHAQFTSILAFEPTGWTHSSKSLGLSNLQPKWRNNGITLYGVPYSEHSSYLELKQFVQFVQPKRILPTVNNGNPASRKKMESIFKSWEAERQNSSSGLSSPRSQPKMDLWMS